MRKIISKLAFTIVLFLFTEEIYSCSVFADESESDSGELKYYMGTSVNTGKDNGYSEINKIEEDDPHFGWTLGNFFVSGHTRVAEDDAENPVFLKNVGDTITLWFHLEQDINMLNGMETLTISEDTNGYDEYFGIEKTNFGHGALIIKKTDYQNLSGEPVIYTDYLLASATTGADTKVEFFEEGDYEVALNYEIKKSPLKVLGVDVFPSYHNYRIYFKFSVRNGNCMVYPFEVSTNTELNNSSITETGFYLNLGMSRYLDIDIKKEVLKEGADGLTEDVRFNRPAKEGDQYTEEGIYTITVSNHYTGQQTTKTIYVGTNNILKAYVTTGLAISEIEYQIALGAQIAADGTIIPAATVESTVLETKEPETLEINKSLETSVVDETIDDRFFESGGEETEDSSTRILENCVIWIVGTVGILAVIFCLLIFMLARRNISKTNTSNINVNISNLDMSGQNVVGSNLSNDEMEDL